jgi:hypothetical protein
MRLNEEEKDLVHNWWGSDLNIEINRTRYTAILESNVQYIHYKDGSYDRKYGDKRHLHVYIEKGEKTEYNIETFSSPEEAIEFLSNNGDLRRIVSFLEE